MNAREPFVLGDWTVHPVTGTLSGPAGQRRLTPKLADLLVALVRRAGEVVTRDELLREVWGQRSAVSDEPLTRAVAELRKILGDGRAEPAYIETIPKRGYRVIAAVRAVSAAPPARVTPSEPDWLPADSSAPTDAAQPRLPLEAPLEGRGLESARAPGTPARAFAGSSLARAAVAAMVVAAVAAAGTMLVLREPPAAGSARVVSVAVLPFADLSPAGDRQYVADGVHEEVIARLTGVVGLRVAALSTVTAYRGTERAARDVARELGVDAIVQGTVRYADPRVRVTAHVIDPDTDTQIWAETFDRPLSLENLFDLQAEIAAQVAAGLSRSLAVATGEGGRALPAAAERDAEIPTESLSAYEAFLLGKYHYRRRQPGDVRIAVEQFQAAVGTDDRFAEAWDWLAYAWNEAGVELSWITPAEAFPRARAAALRALELDPALWTSSALLGFLRATYDWNWQAGVAELERAAAAAPEETGTVWSYAYVLSVLGRHDEAVAQVRKLADTFPEDGRLKQELAKRLIDAGDFAAAARAANAALASGAEPGQAREVLGIAAFGAGDFAAALAQLEAAVALQQGAAAAVGRLAAADARAGRIEEARKLLTELEARAAGEQMNVVTLARVYVALDERERALALLEQGVEQRQRDVVGVINDPFFDALRGDSRFERLAERMDLTLF